MEPRAMTLVLLGSQTLCLASDSLSHFMSFGTGPIHMGCQRRQPGPSCKQVSCLPPGSESKEVAAPAAPTATLL